MTAPKVPYTGVDPVIFTQPAGPLARAPRPAAAARSRSASS